MLPAITERLPKRSQNNHTSGNLNTVLIIFPIKMYSPSCERHINYLNNLNAKNYNTIYLLQCIEFRPAHVSRDYQPISTGYDSGSLFYINYLYFP